MGIGVVICESWISGHAMELKYNFKGGVL